MEEMNNQKELRIVILGGRQCGKTTVAQSLLRVCKLDHQTTQCVKMDENVHGLKIHLVDTPGWWNFFLVRDSPEFLKMELIRSVTLCPPGPHVVLLVIEADIAFTEDQRKTAEDHMQLIDDQIWKHTIIIFTKLESLGDKTIEQCVENESESLKELIEKCGNRYHSFDSNFDTDDSQAKELLKHIEKFVAEHSGHYFKVDAEKQIKLELKIKTVEQKAFARKQMVLEKRRKFKELISADAEHRSKPLNIVLLGWVLSGKTLASSIILSSDEPSYEKTVKCHTKSGEVDGTTVKVVDTPSWWKFLPYLLNADSVNAEIIRAINSGSKSSQAILLVIPVDTSFSKEHLEVLLDNMKPLGEEVWRQTMVLFTWGDLLGDQSIEHHIESEGDALVKLIDMCSNRYHVFENTRRDDDTQVKELLKKIEQMIVENTLNLSEEALGEKLKSEESETFSEWLRAEDVKKLLNEEWERNDTMMKKMLKQMTHQGIVKRDGSLNEPPLMSGELVKTEFFVNKQQLKDPLEREWIRRKAIDSNRIQYEQKRLFANNETSLGADMREIQRSVAKVESWHKKNDLSDYGSICSNEEQDVNE